MYGDRDEIYQVLCEGDVGLYITPGDWRPVFDRHRMDILIRLSALADAATYGIMSVKEARLELQQYLTGLREAFFKDAAPTGPAAEGRGEAAVGEIKF